MPLLSQSESEVWLVYVWQCIKCVPPVYLGSVCNLMSSMLEDLAWSFPALRPGTTVVVVITIAVVITKYVGLVFVLCYVTGSSMS